MRKRRHKARALSASGVALAALAGSILWAVPAQACSCGMADMDEALAAGDAIAIVTRTDSGRGAEPNTPPPTPTYRVEDSVGPELPGTLYGSADGSEPCESGTEPRTLAAFVVERKDDAWRLAPCGYLDLGPALQRVQGDPVAVAGGPVVAYAAGDYESSRLAALDSAGRIRAWDKIPGYGDHAALCPGGKTVVVLGRTPGKQWTDQLPELTVHDAATLRVLRTVKLGKSAFLLGLAVRCADERAEVVQVLVGDRDDESYPVGLLTVRGDKTKTVDAGRASSARAVPDGFVVLDGVETKTVSLALVRPDGRRSTVAALPDLSYAEGLTVSPDGRTATIAGSGGEPGSDPLVVAIDVESGKRLGELDQPNAGLAWTPAGELLVREEERSGSGQSPVRIYDRALTERGDWPAVPGPSHGHFATLGDAAVVRGTGIRTTVTPREGRPFVFDSIRLAVGGQLVAVPGAEFDVGKRELSDVTVADRPSTDARVVGVVGGVSAAALAWVVVLRRRNRGA